MLMSLRQLSPGMLVNLAVLTYIFSGLMQPWEPVTRAVFFLLMCPAVIWAFVKKEINLSSHRSFLLPLAVMMSYLAVSALFLSDASHAQGIRRVRWSFEVLVWIAALLHAIPLWIKDKERYAFLFCGLTLVSAVVVFWGWGLETHFKGRLRWTNDFDHPTHGASLLLVYWSIGLVLSLLGNLRSIAFVSVSGVALVAVLVVLFLTTSRGPMAAALLACVAYTLVLVRTVGARNSAALLVACFLALFLAGMLASESSRWALDVMQKRELVTTRSDMWFSMLKYHPDSHWFGAGNATAFADTHIGGYLLDKYGRDFSHVHNTFLDIYNRSGVVGLVLFAWVAHSCFFGFLFRRQQQVTRRVLVIGSCFLAGAISLHMAEAFRLVSAPNPDWQLLWLPLLFVYSCFRSARQNGLAREPGVPAM